MTMKEKIQLIGAPQKMVLTEDGQHLIYVDKMSSAIYIMTLDGSYENRFIANVPNLTKMIVKDNVIYAYDLTLRAGTFDTTKGVVDISYSQTRDNYADGFKRTYSNALSEENVTKRTEYLGFRNSDEVLMTLENMRVETNFPIYKIDKMYLCY